MRLHWSPRSPYVRKVMIALHETGLAGSVEIVRTPVSFLTVPGTAVLALNPLGKIPILETGEDGILYDSNVICEYLDVQNAAPRLLPEGASRPVHRRWTVLGDGVLDLLVRWQVSQAAPEPDAFRDAAQIKIAAALAAVAKDLPKLRDTRFGMGHIALVAAAGHLDFRFADSGWRAAFPDLAAWADDLGTRASVAATVQTDEDGTPLGSRPQGLDLSQSR
ncbi:glutathione S-transferase [Rhodobacterales bacterium HKCCE2091]|nr:glutathione S-transferase [Rhodobacterales bacterium HKCCE2091]